MRGAWAPTDLLICHMHRNIFEGLDKNNKSEEGYRVGIDTI